MLKDTEKTTQKIGSFLDKKKQQNIRIKYKFVFKKTRKSTTKMAENKSQQTINELCKKLKSEDYEAEAELPANITNEIEQFVIQTINM